MDYLHQIQDVAKKMWAMFMTQMLHAVIKFDRIANPDKYRIEQPVHQEVTIRDNTTQTESDNYLDFTNLPCYPIQHKRTIPDTLKSLIANKSLSDVTFCVYNEYVAAHRLILAGRSDVFHTMLYGFTSAPNEIVYISDISMDIFRQLLSYIYTNHIDLTHDNVIEILYAAHKYNLSFLEERCEQFIYNHRTYGNVLGTINQLFQFSAFETIKSKLFQFVCDNFYDNFSKVDCLTKIDSIDLVKALLERLVLLDHQPDHGRFEFDLFNMLVQWAKVKTKDLNVTEIKWDKVRSCLDGAEHLINFENMNAELLNKCVAANNGFFTKDEICKFFTRENTQSDTQYPRNNGNAFEVCNEGDGFVVFRADPTLMNRQLKAILPAGSFKFRSSAIDEIEP